VRFASSLVLAEHDGTNLSASTLSAIGAAAKLGDVSVLVCGSKADAVAAQAGTAAGVTKVLFSKTDSNGMLPESITPVILASQKQFSFSHIVAAATAVGKVRRCAFLACVCMCVCVCACVCMCVCVCVCARVYTRCLQGLCARAHGCVH
jgi:electron transfer flavoprotein alpha subunit